MPSDDWPTVPLVELAADVPNATVGGPFGSNLLNRDFRPSGVPVIRGENLGGRWVSGPFVFVSPEKARTLAANIARPGDLIFTQRGTLGQVSMVPAGSFPEYIVSQSQMKLTPDTSRADLKFLYYTFRSAEQQEYVRQNAIRTGVPHTNLGILRRTPVRLPPLGIQREIGKILGALDERRETNEAMNRTIEALTRAIFRSWFVDFEPVRSNADGSKQSLPEKVAALFPNDLVESEIGLVPKDWEVRVLGDVVEVGGGSTPSTTEPAYWGGSHAWATPKDLAPLDSPVLLRTERTLTDAGVAETTSGLLPPGVVLLSSRAPIGYLAISEIPVAVNQGFITMVCGPRLSNYYMLHWARHNHDAIVARANGTTFLEISKKNFRPMQLVVPPQEVMDAFTSFVAPLHRRVVENLKQNDTLATLRGTLLPKLLAGEVRVPVEEVAM